ncbi:tetratricopeptide repeat-containing sensor histidine kinase [Mucilaginibacter aquaedulcis]|uniref:tetratricopeptide repeat-containing sensor histidine kinase n=1 Tax=Mucilaginibacter aquaedulcis TaxID=1187081 RepID=UPI0025B3D6C0|nr:histidine kinase dimerization/phosphoacceptor domain -containing protein [Mucilaginibacter aquaedulcis]MDN3549171.1 histidine kinase dimerization/phosphoacceptor domain -containing protein [Mucilaginibacter aquaedulcis]
MLIKLTPLHVFKHYILGFICLFLVVVSFSEVKAQPNSSGYHDQVRQRLLIRITGNYLYTVCQGQIDLDSSIHMSANIYGLSPLLAYNEKYSDGKETAWSALLDAGKIKQAAALLPGLQGEARLRQLFDLSIFWLFKSGTQKADLDQASKYINEAINLSKNKSANWKVASMTLQANLLNQMGQKEESQKLFTEIAMQCQAAGNAAGAAQAQLSAGELLPFGDPARMAKFEQALPVFTSLNLKDKEIEALSDIDIEYFIAKRYDLAEKYLLKVIQLQKQINFRHQQYPYDGLAYMAIRKGDLTHALSYSNKSLESMTTKADSVFEPFFFARRALIYERMLRYSDALTLLSKTLEKRTPGNRLFWYKSFLGKAETLVFLNQGKEALELLKTIGDKFPPITFFEKMHFAYLAGETHQALKNYKLAEENYKIFLSMAEKFPPAYIHDEYPSGIVNIASFYRIIGQNVKARELLELGKNATPKFDMEHAVIYYSNLYKIDSAEKNYLKAFKELQLSQYYADSAFSFDQRKKVAELLVKYEAEKKDKNIKLLNNQNQLAQIKAQQANRTKNITLIGVVLLIVIIGLLFNRYLTNKNNNKKLEANQMELDQKNVFLETLNIEQDKLLKEKEWLLKEVHHRVKNNLQMVTSLLYSQSVYLEDKAAKLAVNDSLRRMQAMSLIHQKLYQDENTTTIAMPEYINDLVQYLNESFDAGNRIAFEQSIEMVNLDVSQAIPLGLIITESIVNAIKYAFLNGEKGIVSIILQHDGPDSLILKVLDNGMGLPAGFDMMEHNSLGLELMRGLTRQLNGYFGIETDNGVHITVRFIALRK